MSDTVSFYVVESNDSGFVNFSHKQEMSREDYDILNRYFKDATWLNEYIIEASNDIFISQERIQERLQQAKDYFLQERLEEEARLEKQRLRTEKSERALYEKLKKKFEPGRV